MFYGCKKFNSGLFTKAITPVCIVNAAFYECLVLNQFISWDITYSTDLTNMFHSCQIMTDINMSFIYLNMFKIGGTNAENMFYNCHMLTFVGTGGTTGDTPATRAGNLSNMKKMCYSNNNSKYNTLKQWRPVTCVTGMGGLSASNRSTDSNPLFQFLGPYGGANIKDTWGGKTRTVTDGDGSVILTTFFTYLR